MEYLSEQQLEVAILECRERLERMLDVEGRQLARALMLLGREQPPLDEVGRLLERAGRRMRAGSVWRRQYEAQAEQQARTLKELMRRRLARAAAEAAEAA